MGWFLAAALAGLVGHQVFDFIGSKRSFLAYEWDLMMLSGFSLFALGVCFARGHRRRFRRTLERVQRRGTLVAEPSLDLFAHALNRDRRLWPAAGALALAAITLAAYLVAEHVYDGRFEIAGIAIAVVAGGVAGIYVGHMASYGFLGPYFRVRDLQLRPVPGYADNAAGLKPLGDLYFKQASLILPLAVQLGAWSLLIQSWGYAQTEYHVWRAPYLGLLAVFILIEVLVFFWPMYAIHREMQGAKRAALHAADDLAHRMSQLRQQLEIEEQPARRTVLEGQLQQIQERHHDLERMPTWPVDLQTRRQFALQNLALLLPFVKPALEVAEII